MILSDIPAAATIFLDANVLVYHFAPDPLFGPACTDLLLRVKRQEVAGCSSTHVLSEVAHRLMTIEAVQVYGWPPAGIVGRLRRDVSAVQKLVRFRQAVQEVPQLGIQVVGVSPDLIDMAAAVSQQTGLLSNDALIVALMQRHGLTSLASHDADFDRVPGLSRYAPA
jgi:predicted nucleic acid-binding protein